MLVVVSVPCWFDWGVCGCGVGCGLGGMMGGIEKQGKRLEASPTWRKLSAGEFIHCKQVEYL